MFHEIHYLWYVSVILTRTVRTDNNQQKILIHFNRVRVGLKYPETGYLMKEQERKDEKLESITKIDILYNLFIFINLDQSEESHCLIDKIIF